MKEVHITVNTDGSTEIDAKGFQGSSCTTATRSIELLLAGNADNVDDKKKPDFFAQNPGQSNTLRN
jgi:hypothetical protein